MKKKISLLTIAVVSATALILILALFDVLSIKGTIANLLWTFLTLTVAGILALNSCTMLERKNKMALISMGLIALSSVLVIACFWSNVASSSNYMKVTLVVSILSVCFNLISSGILKIGNSYKIIQIISYACYTAVAGYLIALSLGIKIFEGSGLKIFLVFAILSFVAFCVITVLSKKQNNEGPVVSKNFVKISKEEYQDLLAIKEKYEKLEKKS